MALGPEEPKHELAADPPEGRDRRQAAPNCNLTRGQVGCSYRRTHREKHRAVISDLLGLGRTLARRGRTVAELSIALKEGKTGGRVVGVARRRWGLSLLHIAEVGEH